MIILRPATMDDRDLLRLWRNDLQAERLTSAVPPPAEVTLKEHEVWLALWISRMWRQDAPGSKMTEGLFMALESRAGIVGTGRVTDNRQSRCPSACLIHYMIAPEHRRKGFGKQLVHALAHKAKDEMGYHTVGAEIARQNAASITCAIVGGVNSIGFL